MADLKVLDFSKNSVTGLTTILEGMHIPNFSSRYRINPPRLALVFHHPANIQHRQTQLQRNQRERAVMDSPRDP